MCVRSRPGAQVPELTERVARASNPRGTVAMSLRDHLDGLWRDEDFQAWYSRDGKPGLSPAQLATVSVLQFLLELSDRAAAEAVRCRIDWKFALGLELDDPGFHHSVLGDFRDRLAEAGRADELLDLALARIKAAGLVTERGRQRTDATHILAAVRDLTRLELVTEAMRAALEELSGRAPGEIGLLISVEAPEWGRRYGRAARLGKNPTRPKTRIKYTGEDAWLLLRYVAACMKPLGDGPRVQALRQVFEQNYLVDDAGKVTWRTRDVGGRPAPAEAIVSPYDITARYARRGQTRWKGFLAHVTETCDDDGPNIITDVTTTAATVHDTRALPTILAKLDARSLLPDEHFVDQGYTSVELRRRVAADHDVRLVGPIRAKTTRKPRTGVLFDRDKFTIKWDEHMVICPDRVASGDWSAPPSRAPYVVVRFPEWRCATCKLKPRCTPGKARTLAFLPRELNQVQTEARAEQQTAEWRKRYGRRAGVEGTISEFVNSHGMRQTRYTSQDKTHVQHVLTAIAVNIERVNAHLASGPPPAPRPPTPLERVLDIHRVPRAKSSWRSRR